MRFSYLFVSFRIFSYPNEWETLPLYPLIDPIWAYFVGISAQFGVKKNTFFSKKLLKIIFYRFPDGLGHTKNENWPFIPTQWTPFVGILGQFGVKKRVFLGIYFSAPNHFLFGPRWSGTLKNPKLALYTPQWTPFGRAPAVQVATQPAWSRT